MNLDNTQIYILASRVQLICGEASIVTNSINSILRTASTLQDESISADTKDDLQSAFDLCTAALDSLTAAYDSLKSAAQSTAS